MYADITDVLTKRIHKLMQGCSSNCKYMKGKYVCLTEMKKNLVDLEHRGRNTLSFKNLPYWRRVYSPLGVLIYTMQTIFEVS